MPKVDFTKDNKFLALGPTFRSHQKEIERNPRWPDLWMLPQESVINGNETIKIPNTVSDIKPGVELTAVIGNELWQGSEQEAWDAVKGFTISNDVTATGEWPGWPESGKMKTNFAYKMFPTFSPVLSQYEPKNSLEYYNSLEVNCTVDGETSISGNLSGLYFDIPEMISYVSNVCKLQEGDLIALGDPGYADIFLDDRDEVVCTIEGIGELENRIITNS